LLTEHPCRVQRAVVVLDGLRQSEAEAGVPLVERLHVVGDEVDVVEAVDAGPVSEVVALVMVTDPLDLVEVLDHEAERILHTYGGPDSSGGPRRVATDLAAAVGVEQRSRVKILWCSHPERESRTRRLASSTQDQAVVHELLVAS
jgi:hypothetical protein